MEGNHEVCVLRLARDGETSYRCRSTGMGKLIGHRMGLCRLLSSWNELPGDFYGERGESAISRHSPIRVFLRNNFEVLESGNMKNIKALLDVD